MREEEAREWTRTRFDVSRETWDKLESYVAMLLKEMEQQNLIAASTRELVWNRHIADSAQLLSHGQSTQDGYWLDLGSGAGLPGIVVAILSDWPVKLVESRRKRIDFLRHIVEELNLRAEILGGRLESLAPLEPASVISARAFAPLPRLIDGATRFSDKKTVWILPKGRNAELELESLPRSWQSAFHVKQSITDPDSYILVAQGLRGKPNR